MKLEAKAAETGWDRLDKAFRTVITVPKERLVKEEARLKLRKKKRVKKSSYPSLSCLQNLLFVSGIVKYIVAQISKALTAVCRDPDDNIVLECALQAQAQYIVSGDKDLLELKAFRNIRIIRAAEFSNLLAT